MLTAQSRPGAAAVGTQKPRAPEEPSAWWGWEALEREGGTAFWNCSTRGLEGHLTISPIPAGSGWHHPQLSEPRQCWAATDAGWAALDLLWEEVSWLQWPSKKKSIRLGLHDANLARGRGIHADVLLTKRSRLLLIHGTELPTWCQASSSSQQAQGGGRWDGRAGPALTAASPGACPLLFFLTLTSLCAALCVTRDYKSYSNGEDYFYLLDSTTGKLIVIRGCKEWFTFPALGKIMTQVLHPQW